MKKNYTIIVAVLISWISSFAQPVLNASDLPTSTSTNFSINVYRYSGTVSGISQGNAGPNQVWDFSALTTLTFDGTSSVVPVASVPFASSFPTANFASQFVYAATGGGCPIQYSLGKITATFFEKIAHTNGSCGYTDLTLNPEIYFTFPYTYNTVINYAQSSPVIIPSYTSTYDAYGTLITPFGTYTNVIRRKIVNAYETSYDWFITNPYHPIMSAVFFPTGNPAVFFNENTSMSVNENNKKNLVMVYPNPTKDLLHIDIENELQGKITDLTGKTLMNVTTKDIDVSSLSAGIYLLDIVSEDKHYVSKIIKE